MALGSTEAFGSGFFGLTPEQVQISSQMSFYATKIMRGVEGAVTNPDAAMGGAGSPQNVSSEGIGSTIDFEA